MGTRTNRICRTLLTAVLAVGLLATAVPAAEPQNMIGRQSQNEGILVLPKPGDVTIDGNLDDWDWSGRIWVFADKNVRSRFSAEVAAMWDGEYLYYAAKWRDPTPMFSNIDPAFNPESGWKSDSIQLRVRTEDQASWLTTWYFTKEKMPVLHVAHWKDMRNSRKGQDVRLLKAEPGGIDLGEGAQMAYKAGPDGKSYVQEIRIPWTIIFKDPPKMEPGVVFRMGMEFLWGDPTGETWPIHRYADNMQPEHTSREFYWTAWKAWGDAKLVGEGNVPVRQYVSEEAKVQGTVPIRVELPADAARFTLVIDDEDGKRVRTLGADLDPADYTVERNDETITVQVFWDCLKDLRDYGSRQDNFTPKYELVDPGAYNVSGLYHKGLGAEYEMCFYNPGTPPWETTDGSGAWGADHSAPLRVDRAGERVIVSWAFAEGGDGIIGIGPDRLKQWGEKRGGRFLAANTTHVYAVPASWHLKEEVIIRMSAEDGSYQPFVLDGEARAFELPTRTILNEEAAPKVTGLAATDAVLAVALEGRGIVLLDTESAAVTKEVKLPAAGRLAFGPEGTLYTLADGKVHRVDVDAGTATPVATPGVGTIADLAIDNDGNILVADMGPDSQVKAFSPEGKPVYTCGAKGGRPIRGPFQPEAMMRVSSISVDAKGDVWAVESWNYPRRVSVWNRDGKLVRDYIGNTGYAGTGCFLHDQDPTLGYVGPVEIKLNKADRTWAVSRILWAPDREKGESFPVPTSSHVHPQRFRSDASGQMREYLYTHDARDGGGHVLYMEREDGWKPVSAVCLVGHIFDAFTHHGLITRAPTGDFADLNPRDGVFWNDTNKDGIVQRTECEIVKTKDPGKVNDPKHRGSGPLALNNGWGGRIGTDFVFYCEGVTAYEPIGFDDDGAPRYGAKGMRKLAIDERGDLVPVPEEDRLLCLSWKGYAGPTRLLGIDTKAGAEQWYYPNPFPGVHGSHRATMPKPGLLIGPLKIMGVAKANDEVGHVFMMRGNLGQDFLMTSDGVYVGTMMEDGRLPGLTLPPKEEQLVGMPMEGFSEGGEPFNGWFGRQADGKVRMTTGFARQASMILGVKGLESLQRLEGPTVALDMKAIAEADAANRERAAADQKTPSATVRKFAEAPTIDGKPDEWKDVPAVTISRAGSPESAKVRLAYDDAKLYLLYEVRDASPWVNQGKDHTRLFKTGDALDLQIRTTPGGLDAKRRDPGADDVRLLISKMDKKAVAVLMDPVAPDAPDEEGVRYHSPIMDKDFDRVVLLDNVEAKVQTHGGERYVAEIAVPLAALGLKPQSGQTYAGDIGFISSDAAGMVNSARTYWANKQTNLVNDLPSEAWLYPNMWGELTFE